VEEELILSIVTHEHPTRFGCSEQMLRVACSRIAETTYRNYVVSIGGEE